MWLSEAPRINAVLSRELGLDFAFTVLRYVALEENESERWTRTLFVLEPAQPLIEPPLGHGKHLASIPLGVRYTLDADRRTLTLEESPWA